MINGNDELSDYLGYEYYGHMEEIHKEKERQNMTPLDMVKEYQLIADQHPDPDLYSYLIFEEFNEWYYESKTDVEELKELADLVYVIYGLAYSKGWDLNEAVRRVHENNIGRMRQPDGSIKRREDGKIIKNKNYPKVNLDDLV